MKSKHLKYFFLIWLLYALSSQVQGQRDTKLLNHLPLKISEKLGLLPAPSISYKPETKWSFGMALIGSFKPDPMNAVDISTAQLDLVYTINKQLIIDLDHHLILKKGKWMFSGSNSFYKYPELFFPQDLKEDPELIEYQRLDFDNKIFFKIKGNWYAGLVHRLQYMRSVEFLQAGSFEYEKPTGYQGGIAHGLGIGLSFDQRNNILNPTAGGAFFNLNTGLFSYVLGSQFDFFRIEADYRKYLQIGQNHILAFQAFGIFNHGNPPFKLTGELGGSQIMRGYYLGRYRNRQMLSFQTEIRLAIYKRLGMTVFASFGNVADDILNLTQKLPLAGCGLGIRYMLDEKNQANLRLDFAIGKDGHGIYFGYGEAF